MLNFQNKKFTVRFQQKKVWTSNSSFSSNQFSFHFFAFWRDLWSIMENFICAIFWALSHMQLMWISCKLIKFHWTQRYVGHQFRWTFFILFFIFGSFENLTAGIEYEIDISLSIFSFSHNQNAISMRWEHNIANHKWVSACASH